MDVDRVALVGSLYRAHCIIKGWGWIDPGRSEKARNKLFQTGALVDLGAGPWFSLVDMLKGLGRTETLKQRETFLEMSNGHSATYR
ncbi:hypothetical protein Pyn_03745 [Prunus yedoensis var. nudiflora]|uniref:Uncharacterized protein n=1 Tax=Prunus yedoensis var. nudiflora TaxID=2094558 RepID=A0A314UPE6_PRUYE|nr:hypothetical protein Pyn_03745 [Prunus yedoensis var. nudiflora]